MIRRATIGLLSFAALTTLVSWVVSTGWLLGCFLEQQRAIVVVGYGRVDCIWSRYACAFEPEDFSQRFRVIPIPDGVPKSLGLVLPKLGMAGIKAHLSVPLWLPFLLFALYPTVAFVRCPLRRYRRCRKGLCIKCGYDLTGNVSGVCPECGRAVSGARSLEDNARR